MTLTHLRRNPPTTMPTEGLGALASLAPAATGRPVAEVEVVIPVYNERRDLVRSLTRLADYLDRSFPFTAIITIADNASTDGTWELAQALARQIPGTNAIRLDEKGRGRALTRAWLTSRATVAVYMDVDLSTDLRALTPLVAPLLSGHSDLAIGTRLAHTSHTERGAKREFISRTYNLMLRAALGVHFSDAQCGFKAIRTDHARRLLPNIEDTGWFFDTELLVLAERSGLRIFEVPVDWIDDPNSSVDIAATATDDIRGILRVRRSLRHGRLPIAALRQDIGRLDAPANALFGQLVRFAIVGVISTVLYSLLYYVARMVIDPQAANVVALGLSAIANTAMNRRHTFGIDTKAGRWRHQVQGLAVFGLALIITSGALALLTALAPHASVLVEVIVLGAANLVATVLRFVLLRWWVFAHRAKGANASDPAATTAPASAPSQRSATHPAA